MKLLRVWWMVPVPTLMGPPGHEAPMGARWPYVDEETGVLHLLTDAQRDELDPRWRKGAEDAAA